MANTDDTNAPDDGGEGNGSQNEPRDNRDYEIGYGKPPTATRWPKGQSGNPRGPKKGSRGLKKDLHKALSLPHSIKADGRIVKGTTQELAMFTLAKRAGTGDLRAIRELVDLTLKIFGPEDRGRQRATLSPQDQQLLDRLLEGMDPDEDAGSVGARAVADDIRDTSVDTSADTSDHAADRDAEGNHEA